MVTTLLNRREQSGVDDVPEGVWTAVELANLFGPILLNRIAHDPLPGTATEQDVIDWQTHSNRLFELIDGVLLEKTTSSYESYLAAQLVRLIGNFVYAAKLGVVLGADGMLRLLPNLVRIPDVCFISMSKLPGQFPREPIASLIPDLAIEVLSASNRSQEMEQKLRDYLSAGVREIWYIDPRSKTAQVYEGASSNRQVTVNEVLESRIALPGFSLSLKELFADPVGM